MIRKAAAAIKIICDKKVEENAIINALLAKVICMAGLKNLKFDSKLNKFGAVNFTHYAINFMPSGGNKNNVSKAIDNLFDFLEDDIKKINENISTNYIAEETAKLKPQSKNYEEQKRRIEKEADELEKLTISLSDSTVPALYDSCKLIDSLKRGFIFVKNLEFSSYYEQIAYNKASTNLQFLTALYDLWDGSFTAGRKIRGLLREQIDGITCSVLFMSTFIKMQQTDVRNYYKKDLLTGSCRRFVYSYDYNINYFLNPPDDVTDEEATEAKATIKEIKDKLSVCYKAIEQNQCYIIADDVIDKLNEWFRQKCIPRIKELAKKSNSEVNEIINTYIYNSKWTIVKLLSAYHLFNEPTNKGITDKYLAEVLEFWENSLKSLTDMVQAKTPDFVDTVVGCFIDNQNKILNKTAIRTYCDIDKKVFKDFFVYSYNDIASELAKKGYNLSEIKGCKNEQNYICKPIEQVPSDEKINISYTHTKYGDNPACDYTYKEGVDIEEFKHLIKTATGLSPKKYKNGYRNDANIDAEGIQNTLWLDFDDGLSIEEAKEIFKPYWYVIYTSINHQKPKHDKVCDRFRVVLKVKEPMPNDKDIYNPLINNIIASLGADKNANGISRYFRGNPEAIIYTNNGTYFDWKEYEIAPTIHTQVIQPEQKKYTGSKNGNERILCDENFNTVWDETLKRKEICKGNRDKGLNNAICVLVTAVNNGDISHYKAIQWVEDVLADITDKEFEEQAKKFRDRIKELKI